LHLAARWREAHPEAKILYVGDTTHDAENAKVLEADCLLFAGGHHSRSRLEACGYPVIGRIEEIVEYLD
jgi:phosphoglycolate phosphatase